MAVSASGDGVCNVYSVRKGVFIRTLSATNQSISTISTITLSPEGYIVFPAISNNQVNWCSLILTKLVSTIINIL